MPDASPAPTLRPWTPPTVETLGEMTDLTLQFGSEIGDGGCPPEDLFC